MKWLAKLFRGMLRLAVVTATLTAIVVALDALLSPEAPDRPDPRA